jgi:hypothetical protein
MAQFPLLRVALSLAPLALSGCIVISGGPRITGDSGCRTGFCLHSEDRSFSKNPESCNAAVTEVLTDLGVTTTNVKADKLGGVYEFETATGIKGTIDVRERNGMTQVKVKQSGRDDSVCESIISRIGEKLDGAASVAKTSNAGKTPTKVATQAATKPSGPSPTVLPAGYVGQPRDKVAAPARETR